MGCELAKNTVKYLVGLLSIWPVLTIRLAVVHSKYAVDINEHEFVVKHNSPILARNKAHNE